MKIADAPGAIGPYSQAIKVGDLLFCSGCIPVEPSSGSIPDGIEAQTKQALKNLRAVVEAGDSELGKVVKTTVFLKSMNDFATVNKLYEEAFGNHKPARSAVEVARLPKDVLVEVECIARTSYLANILDASQFSSLESVESVVYQIQAVIRKDNLQYILEDLLAENNTNTLPFVLSCLDPQQQSWILDCYPQNSKDYRDSPSERLIIKLSRFFLVAPTLMPATLSLPRPQEKEIDAVQSILEELASLEFAESPISETNKQSQRQMKKQRRAAAKSRAINPLPFKLLETAIPTDPEEVEELRTFLITRQKSVLQDYLEYLCSEDFGMAIREACVIVTAPPLNIDTENAPTPAFEDAEQVTEVLMRDSAYPKIQPMKSALHFDSPEGFGDWIIVIHEGAERELRFRHKKERKTFDIIVKKIRELSHGHFSPDNCKRLNKAGSDAVVFEAKMTGDLRLVYQIDLVPHFDDRIRQALKVFGIFTHAQMDDRLWDAVGNSLVGRSREYRERCAARERTPNADDHTFSPAFFPPLPEASEYREMGKMLVDEANLLHSRFLMAKYVMFSQPLMNTMLADLDATFPHLVSPQEKVIIEHPNSCYVVGRSGTGKTTTLLFKMLLVEHTYQLAESGTPKPRQVFVTQSRILAKKVKEYFATLARALQVSTQSPNELRGAQDTFFDAEDDNIALDDIKDWYRDLPARFSQLEDHHFPLFVTYSALCSMLEADMAVRQSSAGISLKGAKVSSKVAKARTLVDYDYFVKYYWRSLPEPLTKKLDPSLAFSELIGVIKGSEATLSCHPHLLPQEAYLETSGGRHATLAADGSRIYALYDAYARRKKLAGERDVADRTHVLLDFLNEFGVPGQKLDHLYVDEVQDNLLIDTLVLRALCLNHNGLFWAGDTAQAISAGSSFSFNELRAFQWRLETHPYIFKEKRLAQTTIAGLSPVGSLSNARKAEIFQLAVNYRSHAGIVDCAHSIVDLIHRFWPGSIDALAREQGMVDGPKPIFFDGKGDNASVLSKYLFGDSGNRIEFGAQQCILVRDNEAKTRLKEEMGDDVGLVLTIYDSKGLEFNDVLLYNFFQDSNADVARWRVVLNAIDNLSTPVPKFDSNKHASIWLDLKFMYVAMTRARENVWIADISDKGEPMKEYFVSRDLVRSMTPGVNAPRLASSSTPEEWFFRGKQLFHLKKYPEAKHCYERARKPEYVLMAEAYILQDIAIGTQSTPRRQAAFRDAGQAFRRCSGTFQGRRSEYLLLSAGCFREAGEYYTAGNIYREIHYYGDAVECYLEFSMFDEAVRIVLEHKDDLEPSLADKTIKKAKFYYFSSADSLPASHPKRKIHIEQGCELFEPSEDPLEYLEDRLLSGAMGDVLVAALRHDEAAELHLSEGRILEAIELFLQSPSESSSRRAGECVLEALWQVLPFGTGALEAIADPNTARVLNFASNLSTDHLDVNGRQELLMLRHILSQEPDRTALREAGRAFFASQNTPAAVLCLDYYFDDSPTLRNEDLALDEVVQELELFHLFVERLLSAITVPDASEANELPKLFGYRKLGENQVDILPNSLLYRHFSQRHGPDRVRDATLMELHACIRNIALDRLGFLTDQVNEVCKNVKAFSLCLPFTQVGYCKRSSCPKAHVRMPDLDGTYYTLRVRIHLQVILLLTKFQHNTAYRHNQRRYWLTRLYEALYPPHYTMGGMANLNVDLLPESDRERVGKIKYWVEGFIYSHKLIPVSFLSLLLRGAVLALEAVPSMSTLVAHRSLIHDTEPSRYLYRGNWSREFTPPHFLRANGRSSVHDLLASLEGLTVHSLTRGILGLRHVVQKKVKIEISIL
ncbi:hypothetical protein V5O48_010244, partial [Marasmius crinis-equi]